MTDRFFSRYEEKKSEKEKKTQPGQSAEPEDPNMPVMPFWTSGNMAFLATSFFAMGGTFKHYYFF